MGCAASSFSVSWSYHALPCWGSGFVSLFCIALLSAIKLSFVTGIILRSMSAQSCAASNGWQVAWRGSSPDLQLDNMMGMFSLLHLVSRFPSLFNRATQSSVMMADARACWRWQCCECHGDNSVDSDVGCAYCEYHWRCHNCRVYDVSLKAGNTARYLTATTAQQQLEVVISRTEQVVPSSS